MGWSRGHATAKAVSPKAPLRFLPSEKTAKENPAADDCQEVKDTDSRAVGKRGGAAQGRPFHSGANLRSIGEKEKQELPVI